MTYQKDWLATQAIASPKKLALIYGQEQWTYAELDQQATLLANALLKMGVRSNQHVAVLLKNQANYVFLIHALAKLNVIFVPINIRLTKKEIQSQINHADCTSLILDSSTINLVNTSSLENVQITNLDTDIADDQIIPFKVGKTIVEDNDREQPFNLENTQAIVFTSGTTGKPKGAMLSYANHFHSAIASALRLGNLPEDRWLLCMPLYHLGGMAIVFRAAIYGITVVLQSGFDENVALKEIYKNQISMVSLVPTMLSRLLEVPRAAEHLAKLRIILLGGAAVSKRLIEECRIKNLKIATTYGLTETASQVVTANPTQVLAKPCSVGKALFGSSLKVVDENEKDMPPGEIGEILVSGPTIMKGYYHQAEETEKILMNNYLHTGDLGYLDNDGDLWIVQRRVDLIVSGGENVYPIEIENVLLQNPAIEQVCVVGIPHDEWGQQVSAAVVLKVGKNCTEEELVNFSRENLAGYKIPRIINVFKSLPLTATGKIIRKEVFFQMKNRLNMQARSEQ